MTLARLALEPFLDFMTPQFYQVLYRVGSFSLRLRGGPNWKQNVARSIFSFMEGPKKSELQTPERPVVWISHKDGEHCTICGTELRSGNFIQIARDTGI